MTDIPESPDDTIGQQVDAKIEELRVEVNARFDEFQAKLDELQAAIDEKLAQ